MKIKAIKEHNKNIKNFISFFNELEALYDGYKFASVDYKDGYVGVINKIKNIFVPDEFVLGTYNQMIKDRNTVKYRIHVLDLGIDSLKGAIKNLSSKIVLINDMREKFLNLKKNVDLDVNYEKFAKISDNLAAEQKNLNATRTYYKAMVGDVFVPVTVAAGDVRNNAKNEIERLNNDLRQFPNYEYNKKTYDLYSYIKDLETKSKKLVGEMNESKINLEEMMEKRETLQYYFNQIEDCVDNENKILDESFKINDDLKSQKDNKEDDLTKKDYETDIKKFVKQRDKNEIKDFYDNLKKEYSHFENMFIINKNNDDEKVMWQT